jgi:hypothetical protein
VALGFLVGGDPQLAGGAIPEPILLIVVRLFSGVVRLLVTHGVTLVMRWIEFGVAQGRGINLLRLATSQQIPIKPSS